MKNSDLTFSEEKIIKSVDDYLNEVNYTELANYKPSVEALVYINFMRMIYASNDLNETPPVHLKMVDGLMSPERNLINLCFRGLGKTTLMANTLIMYLMVFCHLPKFGKINTAVYISDTMENGAKNFRNSFENTFNNSDYLRGLLEITKLTDNYIETITREKKPKKFGVRLYGANTSIRGVKILDKRPQLCILDDLITDAVGASPTSLARLENNIITGIFPALDPRRRKIIWCGTPFSKSDPLYKAVESGEWKVNVYPVCEKFPCTREEFKSAWEDRFTYDSVKESYGLAMLKSNPSGFNQEFMLRIATLESRIINDEDIRWFNTEDIIKNKSNYNFYITSDFATSTSKKADYTALGVWAVDADKNRYLVDGKVVRQPMNKTFDDIFHLVQKWKPFSVGIEATGQQGGFIQLFKSQMVERNIYFNIASSIGSNKEGIMVRPNKMDRFRLTLPYIAQGKFFLPRNLKQTILIQEVLEELSMATLEGFKSKHDDAIDMISQLDQMWVTYPDKEQIHKPQVTVNNLYYFTGWNTEDKSEEHNIADYLV